MPSPGGGLLCRYIAVLGPPLPRMVDRIVVVDLGGSRRAARQHGAPETEVSITETDGSVSRILASRCGMCACRSLGELQTQDEYLVIQGPSISTTTMSQPFALPSQPRRGADSFVEKEESIEPGFQEGLVIERSQLALGELDVEETRA